MTPAEFLMLTGIVTWCWLAWRLVRWLGQSYRRMRWALVGYRQPRQRLG